MNFNNIPEEIKTINNWSLWKLEKRNDKTTKHPYQIDGVMAKVNVPSTWTTFDKVIETYIHREGVYSGIGFNLLGSGVTIIDLDHCIDNGKMSDEAQTIIDFMGSYTEKSQSGTGVHILAKGNIPKALHQEIEMYNTKRYFALTGDIICGDKIESRQEQLDFLYKKHQKKKIEKTPEVKSIAPKEIDGGSADLLEKAFNSKEGSKIKSLYCGDISGHNNDHSKADQALCNYLAFWFNKDWNDIDNIFKQSSLYRVKWDRADYKASTIDRAINGCNKSYQEMMQERKKPIKVGNKVEAEELPEYLYTNNRGNLSVNTGLLAKFIRENNNYMIVRKQGYDNDFLYWYENGYYKKSSPNGFKGKIKKHIPEDIRKANHFEEVYKELITDTTGIKFEDLNDAREYINVKNGLYNVKTKTLEKHNPKLLSTIQLNCDYEPKAKGPIEWFKFIDMLAEGDQNIMAILQEWFGLTLSNIPGSITKKCLSLHGSLGNTGKTQYGNMLIHLLSSDNICSTPIQDFSKTFATGDLYGAKAVVIDDQKSVNIDDSSTFKSITGGGFIRCEQKGKQAFPYEFKGTLTFSCNDLPYFKGDKGDHLFERFIIIPCNNVISEDKRIGDIIERFKLETNGIFQWALEGLHRLIDNNYKFTHSDICSAALEEYKFANDSFYKFIKESYIITFDKKDRVKKTFLEDEYIRWAFSNEIQSLDKKNISARALKHGIGFGKIQGERVYMGIKRNLLTEIGDEIPF